MRLVTAGESHGRGLVAVVEGLPAGLPVDVSAIDHQLARRQAGYGRGGRMQIEHDRAEILSGVLDGHTIGAPVAVLVWNRDWRAQENPITRPRPGHADLVGALKYGFDDVRYALERASARETAARVAGGTLARLLLEQFGIRVFSHVISLGEVTVRHLPDSWEAIAQAAETSEVRCADAEAAARMREVIDEARARGDTLGGVVEIVALGVPPGLGSYVHWDRRLDGRLAQAVMSVQAIKGVAIGDAFAVAATPGSLAHDEIHYDPDRGFYRETNRAGGLEAGVTNGMPLVVRAAMKPLATLRSPLHSVDLRTLEPSPGAVVRSDVTTVPAAGVVCEAMVCLVLADALCEKFGQDTLQEMREAYDRYLRRIRWSPR
ncbi:MAG: chorismate synthase [Armatimonadota bacterium]|nr:chorismate synthase [Armatimonadota bacterium]MDR7444390.1 chorismate synthase [Armatimonadota bacterium]MDR7570746.1 chorismate synthase [Armatimonadota bacterium]MDR7614876.1 chorismate synthase [Armatimonadota bacterium]